MKGQRVKPPRTCSWFVQVQPVAKVNKLKVRRRVQLPQSRVQRQKRLKEQGPYQVCDCLVLSSSVSTHVFTNISKLYIVYIYIYIHLFIYEYIYIQVNAYVCIYVNMHTCIHICIMYFVLCIMWNICSCVVPQLCRYILAGEMKSSLKNRVYSSAYRSAFNLAKSNDYDEDLEGV